MVEDTLLLANVNRKRSQGKDRKLQSERGDNIPGSGGYWLSSNLLEIWERQRVTKFDELVEFDHREIINIMKPSTAQFQERRQSRESGQRRKGVKV